MEGLWGLVIIGGPIVLGGILLWAIMHNRTSRARKAQTEQATKDLYDEQDRADRQDNPRI